MIGLLHIGCVNLSIRSTGMEKGLLALEKRLTNC